MVGVDGHRESPERPAIHGRDVGLWQQRDRALAGDARDRRRPGPRSGGRRVAQGRPLLHEGRLRGVDQAQDRARGQSTRL